MNPELNQNEKIKVEDMLIEMLIAAVKSPPHIRKSLADLSIGLAETLDATSVERCKEYASYRIRNEGK